MELDIGVPSSSELKILNGLDLSGVLTWIGVGSSIDLGPERATIGVEARLVGVDALATFFLTVVWNFAEHANLLVPVGVAPGLRLIRVPPRVGIAPVAAGSSVVAPEVPVLTPGCLIERFLWAIVDGIDGVFRIVLNGKNMRRSFGFLSGERLDGCKFDRIVKVQLIE
jgi:hypothetical protein